MSDPGASGFQTMGAKTTNVYLLSFVKSMGDDFIKTWVRKHKISSLSVTHLSVVVAANFSKSQEIDDDAKVSLSKDLGPVVLKVLEEGGHVDREQRSELQRLIAENPKMIDDFIILSLELMEDDNTTDENVVTDVAENKKLTRAEKKMLKKARASRKKIAKREARRNASASVNSKSEAGYSSSDSDSDSESNPILNAVVSVLGGSGQ